MNYITPEPLRKGDTIGLVSPSSPLLSDALDACMNYLEQKGYRLKLGSHIKDSKGFLAGTDTNRAQDIMNFFKDPDVKAIIATCGGHGAHRLLPLLDYNVIKANPKILVGFSDTTVLQLALIKKAGLVSYNGFTLTLRVNELLDQTLSSCLKSEPYQIEGADARHKIQLGGLIIKSGLDKESLSVILGLLINARDKLITEKERWRQLGDKEFSKSQNT